ncbi:MAG: flagellar hook basal-body protein [Cyanobacteria bacterium HKST-UBA06]|nr:flagellar hook basal-body protein [Cyanobacteria bacterium HKST-UBA05]MCA9799698.1 flagellar hook basal-body protein [Cyanobacteria bacterium HKST-UBA04]MCA9806742.1 flagellar hook basal-body protein [Cyanobacteria bacterium HKST-UBA06]MCA9842538.1 flagellar hook basal-body protein [Cyanobacteria bacterium HKST-UBA03]
MKDAFVTSVNTALSATAYFNELSLNAFNMDTPGYRQKNIFFSDFINGANMEDRHEWKTFQGKAIPGRSDTNMMIEGKGYFAVRKTDGSLLYTRLGDFTFDKDGTLVNELGYKVQGYLTNEKGEIVNTGATQINPGGSPNNPSHRQGGSGHLPTTEINMWVDPTNGKFFGKYEEFKVKADGTLMGVAEKGKVSVPLYKVAVVGFVNPGKMTRVEEYYYLPNNDSGMPVEGSGEVRSGVIEKSNVYLREQVNYLQFAKLQIEVAQKLINTNKQLLQESVRLLQ